MKTLIELSRKLAYPVLFGALAAATFSNSLFEISSSVFLGLWLVDVAANRRASVFRGAWPLLLGLYVLVNALSALQTPHAYHALKGAFRVLRWALLTLAVTDIVDTKEKLRLGFDAILAVIVFIAFDALIQAATGVEILRGRPMTAFFGETHRVTGPFPHANDFSAYLCLAVFAFAAAVGAAAGQKRRAKLLFVSAGLAVTLACLALTYSRGAWFAVAAALLLWAVLRRSPWPALLIVLFAAAAYLQSPFLFGERMSTLKQFAGGTVTERRILWKESLEMIRERPILGFGVNTYSDNVERFKDPARPTDRQYAHNGYLHIAAETGLLGLAVFLSVTIFFFASTARTFFARSAEDIALLGQGIWLGVAAFLLQSAIDTTLQSLLLAGLLWMWIGLGWSAYRILKSHAR